MATGRAGIAAEDRLGGQLVLRLTALALAAFAGVTTEMLPVGLLPQISRALGVAESTTGLVVTLYATMVAALAVPLTVATRRVPGKRLLLIALGCYAASNLLTALAPTFAVLAAGRALGGVTHALFFSVFIGYSVRLVPPAHMGRALAVSQTGASAGFVLGVPLATALGNAFGWRSAFIALAVVLVVALALTGVVLPEGDAQTHPRAPGAGRRRAMAAVVVSNTLAFLGHYALYTYVSVLLARSGASPAAVGPILLAFGGCGLVGLWTAAHRLDRHPLRSGLAILAVIGVGIVGVGAGFPSLGLVIAAGAVWSAAFGPAATFYQTAAVRTHATSPELAGAWINGTANVGIAGGAALGGAVLGTAGVRTIAWPAAALVGASVLAVVLGRAAFRPMPPSSLPAARRDPEEALTPELSSLVTADIDAVLFDMDGTLVDSTRVVEALWAQFASIYGLELAEVLAFAHGRPTAATVRRFLPAGHDADQVISRFEAEELERVDGITQIAGAQALLESLRGAPVAIVTSAPRPLALRRLAAAGLEVPDVLVTSDDVLVGKPDPTGYLRAAALLGVAPSRCLAFEDAEAGIRAAVASGARTVVVGTHRSGLTESLDRVPDLRAVRVAASADRQAIRVCWPAMPDAATAVGGPARRGSAGDLTSSLAEPPQGILGP